MTFGLGKKPLIDQHNYAEIKDRFFKNQDSYGIPGPVKLLLSKEKNFCTDLKKLIKEIVNNHINSIESIIGKDIPLECRKSLELDFFIMVVHGYFTHSIASDINWEKEWKSFNKQKDGD